MKLNGSLSAKCLLLLLAFALLALTPAPSVTRATAGPEPQGRRVEPIRGEAVKFLVARLRARNRGFDRAVRDMERLGKRPLWEASAALPLGSRRGEVAAFRPASFTGSQDIISDGNGGEMIFITYDGDDSFWDGTIYVHDSSREATYNAVVEDFGSLDTSTWEVVDELYYPPDGGEPIRDQPCSGDYACLEEPVMTSIDRVVGTVNANYARTRGGGWWRSWWGCTRTGCQQSVNGCANSGTFRRLFVCAAVGCTARAVACAL